MAEKLSAGSAGRAGSSRIWRRSTSSTMATSKSSREPKWCNNIRWLVPTAAATSRNERSPTPPVANSSTRASSSCRRRSRSGVRATGAAQLLRPGLQALGLHIEVALGHRDHQPPHERTEHAGLLEPLAHQCAPARLGDDLMVGPRQGAGGALLPRPGRAGLDLGYSPYEPAHAGLLDREPFPDGQARPVQWAERGHRGGPLGPALHVAE